MVVAWGCLGASVSTRSWMTQEAAAAVTLVALSADSTRRAQACSEILAALQAVGLANLTIAELLS